MKGNKQFVPTFCVQITSRILMAEHSHPDIEVVLKSELLHHGFLVLLNPILEFIFSIGRRGREDGILFEGTIHLHFSHTTEADLASPLKVKVKD